MQTVREVTRLYQIADTGDTRRLIVTMKGLTAGVVGLLIAVAWEIAKRVPKHWCCFAVGITTLLLGLAFPVNPVWLALLGALAGGIKVLLAAVFTKKSGEWGST